MAARILIVDDEQDILETIGLNLADEGFDVLYAHGGLRAKELLQENPVDIVVSDVRMPDFGGVDLVRWIRSQAMPTPVVFITGFSDLTEDEITRLGVAALVEKPLRINDLIATINKVLATTSSQRA